MAEKTTTLKYVGPQPAGVLFEISPGVGAHAAHGKAIEVPAALAKNLLKSDDWKAVEPPKAAAPPAEKPKSDAPTG